MPNKWQKPKVQKFYSTSKPTSWSLRMSHPWCHYTLFLKKKTFILIFYYLQINIQTYVKKKVKSKIIKKNKNLSKLRLGSYYMKILYNQCAWRSSYRIKYQLEKQIKQFQNKCSIYKNTKTETSSKAKKKNSIEEMFLFIPSIFLLFISFA